MAVRPSPVWLGGRAVSLGQRTFMWMDDALTAAAPLFGNGAAGYQNFALGEPNNKRSAGVQDTQEDCLQMNHAKHYAPGTWNDAACDRKRGWVCEVCVEV